MLPIISSIIQKIDVSLISADRQKKLNVLVDYIQSKKDKNQAINLNFICTHNSRRSQFSQVWAKVMSAHYGVDVNCFSGGVEITEFNARAIESLKRFGFEIDKNGTYNPIYKLTFDANQPSISTFSKLFDDEINPKSNFAAIMTCSHADANCPFVAGCDQRIPLTYNDPKHFDDSTLESSMYDCRSFEIATEMNYIFSKIK